MEEFLSENYALITHSVEILAAVTGLFCLKRYKGTAVKYFIYFLIYAFLVDFLGNYPSTLKKHGLFYIIDGTLLEKNRWWFTLFWQIGAILFYSFLFQKIIKNRAYVLILKVITNIFLYFSIIYIIFNWRDFFVLSFPVLAIVGAFIIFTCAIFYLMEVLNSNRILNFYKSINFYISATILIWWLIITPIVFYDLYFSKADWNFVFLKWQIFLFANVFMYLSFTFALLWCNPKID